VPQPKSVDKPKQLVVEGKDAVYFFQALLHVVGVSNIQIQNFGSVGELGDFLKLLVVTPSFAEIVDSVGIVRDAETAAPSAAQSIRAALAAADLDVPAHPVTPTGSGPKVSYFILPNNADPGMLETLCLQSVANDPVMPCIENFFTCVGGVGASVPANMTKAKVQAFLATRRNLKRLLGQAAHAGQWNLSSSVFNNLKQYLQTL
jgi:hypothetical protein